nr:P-loop NTPase fold protein [uncultured Dongia sp.]
MNDAIEESLPETTSFKQAADWEDAGAAAIAAFGSQANMRAEALIKSIRQSVRYCEVVEAEKLLLIDMRAMLLGMLSVGLQDTPSSTFGNTATWFADWLQSRISLNELGAVVMGGARTGTDTVLGALHNGFQIRISRSMQAILPLAVGFARDTVGREVADLRHFIAAALTHVPNLWSKLPEFSHLTAADTAAFRRALLERITRNPERGENVDAWKRILAPLPGDNANLRISRLPGFTSDRPATSASGDPLAVDADARAFANLICSTDTVLPLSIGVFGGWGSGKSSFMQRLEERIGDLTSPEKQRPAGTQFVSNIIHIRFNAWHFADANLWASLTAEFFDQLRVGGFANANNDLYARLIDRVNSHVHSLSKTVDATRDALARSRKDLLAAQQTHDNAIKTADAATRQIFSQVLVNSVVDAFNARRDDLQKIIKDKSGAELGDFVELAKLTTTIGGQIKLVIRILWAHRWQLWLAVLAILLLAILCFGLYKEPLQGRMSSGDDWPFGTVFIGHALEFLTEHASWSAVGGIGTFIAALLPALRLVARLSKSVTGFARKLQDVKVEDAKAVLESEGKLRVAAAETKAQEEAIERANRSLSRYVAPDSSPNPPRLLRFILEDNPDTKEMEKEIGLISRARRLFQAVDEIVRQEQKKRLEGKPRDLQVPERIVLYIDDLDRCTPQQVYAVLQAIHLLLAFELFVVVVAVDVRWIERALAEQNSLPAIEPEKSAGDAQASGTQASGKRELDPRKLTINYLEKIFQLPFWLKPLSTDGNNAGSYGAYVQALLANRPAAAQPSRTTPGTDPAPAPDKVPPVGADTQPQAPSPAPQPGAGTSSPVDPPSPAAEVPPAESFEAMILTPEEIKFLGDGAIGRIAPREPRGVKRMINVYRVLRASMSPDDLHALTGDVHTAPTYPLAIFMAALETGQDVDVANNFYDGLRKCLAQEPVDEQNLDATLNPHSTTSEGWKLIGAALQNRPDLLQALRRTTKERGDKPANIGEWLKVARIVRRYSFNRYT